MRRREFLWAAGGAAFAGEPASVLVHEHIVVDFAGADQIRPGRYDRDEVFRIARPKLEEVRRLGCRRLLEGTPNYLGRDPEALARGETAAQLANRWIAETREAWRPRFIKIGVNRGPLDEIDRKLVSRGN